MLQMLKSNAKILIPCCVVLLLLLVSRSGQSWDMKAQLTAQEEWFKQNKVLGLAGIIILDFFFIIFFFPGSWFVELFVGYTHLLRLPFVFTM